MLEEAHIDFTTPGWLVNYYFTIGGINIVLNAYTLFLIAFVAKNIDSYRYYMFAFQFSCLCADFHTSILMQPQPLHPLPGGYCTGLLSNYVSVLVLMTIEVVLIVFQFTTLYLCFFKKLIAFRDMKRLATKAHLVVLVIGGFDLLGVCAVVCMYTAGLTKQEEFELIMEKYPTYLHDFQSLPHFNIYRIGFSWLGVLVCTFVAFIYSAIFFIYSTISMFTILNELRKTGSQNNYKKQKIVLISLLVQLATLACAVLPVGFLAFLLLIEYKYAQHATQAELVIYCFHSSANVFVLVLTNPAFRKFTFFWNNKNLFLMNKPILYSSWSSACPNRVIIALALKKIDYEYRSVNNQTAEEEKEFALDNPAGKVPILKINGLTLTESLAIIEYLDEVYPDPPLLPKDPTQRAHARAIAHHICSNIQPLQNRNITNMLNEKNPDYGMEFCQYHIKYGFDALEKLLEIHSGKFSVGDQVTIADIVLPSMVYNATNKYPIDLTPYPNILRIAKNLSEIPEFQSAEPHRQPDAPLRN